MDHSSWPDNATGWLQLLHLADSALPIGAMAHSFGIEGLVAEAGLDETDLRTFFIEWLHGTGRTEAAFCLWSHAIDTEEEWKALNRELSSLKVARESREASLRLGRRFLSLASGLIGPLRNSYRFTFGGNVHLAAAFGLVSGTLDLPPQAVAAAYLHQSIYGAISCCQRLMPLGQSAAMKLLWDLKAAMVEVAESTKGLTQDDLWNFQPILEIASMRHPYLQTRLFIS